MAAKYAIIEAMDKYEKIAQELGVSLKQIDTVLSLTAEGSTIPFIARYRKDMTGNLDEVAIKAIIDRDKSLTALAERKETVLAKIEEQGKLTEALKQAIEVAEKLADVEELYLLIRKNGGPRRRLPEKQDFSPWHVSFCKIVQTWKQRLRNLPVRPSQLKLRL